MKKKKKFIHLLYFFHFLIGTLSPLLSKRTVNFAVKSFLKLYIRIAKTSQTLFCRSPVEVQSNEPEHSVPKKRRTLMDLDQEESLWPRAKNAEQIPTLKSYIQKFLCD